VFCKQVKHNTDASKNDNLFLQLHKLPLNILPYRVLFNQKKTRVFMA